MTRPTGIKLGRDLSEKLDEVTQQEPVREDNRELVKPKKNEVSNFAKERMEAMSKFNLVIATTPVTARIPDDKKFQLDMICSKFKKDIQELAAKYILEGIEKDIKKVGIFDHENN